MESGNFLTTLKSARVQLLLKKSTLDPDSCTSGQSDFKPFLHFQLHWTCVCQAVFFCLTFLVTVCCRPNNQLIANSTPQKLLPNCLSVHNDSVRAVDDNQLTIVVMLDSSATFDMVDQNVLLPLLSLQLI